MQDQDGRKAGDEIIECKEFGETKEPPIACGKMTELQETVYYCAYRSLMRQHGIALDRNAGCANNLVEKDGKPVDMEICYCMTNACNRNCTCQRNENKPRLKMDTRGNNTSSKNDEFQAQDMDTISSLIKKVKPDRQRRSQQNQATDTEPMTQILILLLAVVVNLLSLIRA